MQYSTHLLRHLRFTIGQNIHRLRAKQKIPLQKLARLSGITEHLLDRYEIGKNEIRLDELLKIACILRVETKELVAYETQTTNVSVYMTNNDLHELKTKAAAEGLPYQTLLSHLVHKYVSGEVKIL